MTAPGPAYPALVLNHKGSLAENLIGDGHHRYYVLIDAGWRGHVPIVHRHNQRRAVA